MTSKRPRLFYGWLIVFVSAVGLFLGGPLVVASFSVFLKALAADLHANRASISFAFSLYNIVGALWLPTVGRLIDRFGARRVILPSIALYSVVLIAGLSVGHSLWQLYLFYALLGFIHVSGSQPVPYGIVISHWFNRRRGLALGLMMMGAGVSTVVVPILTQRFIALFGWRMTFAIFGAAVLLLCLPVVATFLVNDPAQRNLRPDGDQTVQNLPMPLQNKQGLRWYEIWHHPTFWILICIFSLTSLAFHSTGLHMSAIFTDRGASPERGALATSLVGAATMVGRLSSGYLLDRLLASKVALLFYGATTLGMGILSTGSAGTLALLSAFLVGIGMGAEVEIMGFMISRYFGLVAFGAAFGVTFATFMISGALGTFITGAGYNRFHSYTVPLAASCGTMLLALILLTRLGPYRYGVEASANPPINPLEVASGT